MRMEDFDGRVGRSVSLVAIAFALAACSSDGGSGDVATDAGGWPAIHCTMNNTTHYADGSCVRSYSGCSDGHSYSIDCAGTQCSCRIDNAATGHSTIADCTTGDGLAGLAGNCGWGNR